MGKILQFSPPQSSSVMSSFWAIYLDLLEHVMDNSEEFSHDDGLLLPHFGTIFFSSLTNLTFFFSQDE